MGKVNLFQDGAFTAHSGETLKWKIECDVLSGESWACLARRIIHRIPASEVHDVARGGLLLAEVITPLLRPSANRILLVDDVLRTGWSMAELRASLESDDVEMVGVVVFARGPTPDWVYSIFEQTYCSRADGVNTQVLYVEGNPDCLLGGVESVSNAGVA